jgi:hypothetical protein
MVSEVCYFRPHKLFLTELDEEKEEEEEVIIDHGRILGTFPDRCWQKWNLHF